MSRRPQGTKFRWIKTSDPLMPYHAAFLKLCNAIHHYHKKKQDWDKYIRKWEEVCCDVVVSKTGMAWPSPT